MNNIKKLFLITYFIAFLTVVIPQKVYPEEIINLSPAAPLNAVEMSLPLVDITEQKVVFECVSKNASIKPVLNVKPEHVGKTATPFMHVFSPAKNYGFYYNGEKITLSATLENNLFSEIFNLADLKGQFLNVYTGYILDDGNIFYNGYRVILVTKVSDLSYIDDGNARHKLDIYYPEGFNNNKVVTFIFGGAWKQGGKSTYYELGMTLSGYYGYTVAIVNYRLSNDTDGNARHPDHINDVASAFKWLKENVSQYHGDPAKFFLFGQSAGAHLVALLSTDETYLMKNGYHLSDIKGTVSMSGAYNLYNFVKFPKNPIGLSVEDTLLYKVLMQNAFGSWDEAALNSAAPYMHVNTYIPPMLIIDTENDMPGFEKDSVLLVDYVKHSFPDKRMDYYKLLLTDYSAYTWETASAMAAAEPAVSAYVGHYAEVVAINTNDYKSKSARIVTDFINSIE